MVHFASYSIKSLVMEYLHKLKNVDQKFAGINIAHDIMQKERSECKRLVSEAKQQEADDTLGVHIPGTWSSRENENCATKGQAQFISKEIINNDGLKVIYTNADGLLNKRQDLKVFIQCLPGPLPTAST